MRRISSSGSGSNIKVTVLDDRHIRYGKETTSLSALSQQLLKRKAVQGTLHFKYKGEILTDLRNRLEK